MVDTNEAWKAFLNPDIVRTTLIAAGLFLIGHEMLRDSIKRHPLEFFANRWIANGPELSDAYREKVLALDPKGKSDRLRGSIAWLRQMDAISIEDENTIRIVVDVRNEVAHELQAMVGGSKPPDFAHHFSKRMELIQKIEKWWIVNVEISTDPDFDGKPIDEDGIISGPSWIMQMMAQVALGDGDEAWELHREFTKRLNEKRKFT
jgi:hypothetical protein